MKKLLLTLALVSSLANAADKPALEFARSADVIVIPTPHGEMRVTPKQLLHLFLTCFPNVPAISWKDPEGNVFVLECFARAGGEST